MQMDVIGVHLNYLAFSHFAWVGWSSLSLSACLSFDISTLPAARFLLQLLAVFRLFFFSPRFLPSRAGHRPATFALTRFVWHRFCLLISWWWWKWPLVEFYLALGSLSHFRLRLFSSSFQLLTLITYFHTTAWARRCIDCLLSDLLTNLFLRSFSFFYFSFSFFFPSHCFLPGVWHFIPSTMVWT